MLANSKLITKPDFMNESEWREHWLDLRIGRFTASKIHKLTSNSKRKTKGATVLESYVIETIEEMIEGRKFGFQNETMENGNIFEDDAMDLFMEQSGQLVQRLTFLEVGDHVGISADGIHLDGKFGCEIKSPRFKGWVNYNRAIDKGLEFFADTYKEHYAQMQMAMWGFEYDFYYFIPYYAAEYQKNKKLWDKGTIRIFKVGRDKDFIKNMSDKIDQAIDFKLKVLSNYTEL